MRRALTALLFAPTLLAAPSAHAAWAPDDIPVPVLVSLVGATAEPERVRIEWHVAEAGMNAEVWRRDVGGHWLALGTVVSSGDGLVTFEDRSVAPGAAYDHRLRLGGNVGVTFAGEVRVTVPLSAAFALEGARPNPARDGLTVALSLPDDAPATLEVMDVAGRVIEARAVGDMGAGRHLIRTGASPALPPGVYYLRLTRAGRSLHARAVAVR